MKNKIESAKVELPTILGSTTINHAARIQLKLNASEYILMDYIYRCIQKKRKLTIVETYRQTGFTADQQEVLLRHLIEKGFVFPENASPPRITSKWESAYADIDLEFNKLFWRKNGKVFFTGSNKKSCSMYYKLRKKYSREFLIKQRDYYAEFLEMQHKTGFNQSVMMAERWLNPANENYLTDWKEMADNIKKKIHAGTERIKKANEKMEKQETVTSKDRKTEYEQNSN